MRAAADLQRLQHEKALVGTPDLLADDGGQVLVGDLDLAVGELLEPRERPVHVLGGDVDAHLRERVEERVPPAVLAQDERVALEADLDRVHDLVGGAVGQHAVLVDPALVRERAAAHDGLVRLHVVAGRHGHQPRGPRDLLDVEAVRALQRLPARAHDHGDLLERAVAGALADPVHRHLHLAGAVLDAGQRVRHRQPEVVVAVRGDDHVARGWPRARSGRARRTPWAWRSRPCPAR